MSKHTPGPWSYAPTGSTMRGYNQPFGVMNIESSTLVAGVFGDIEGGDDAADANARLIAAAPTLLEALVNLLTCVDGPHDHEWIERTRDAARAAIAQAEGDGT